MRFSSSQRELSRGILVRERKGAVVGMIVTTSLSDEEVGELQAYAEVHAQLEVTELPLHRTRRLSGAKEVLRRMATQARRARGEQTNTKEDTV